MICDGISSEFFLPRKKKPPPAALPATERRTSSSALTVKDCRDLHGVAYLLADCLERSACCCLIPITNSTISRFFLVAHCFQR